MDTILFISGQELMIVMVAVLLLFGSKKIPELARGLGKGMHEFRKATEDIKREINAGTEDIKREINAGTGDIKSEINDMKNDITG